MKCIYDADLRILYLRYSPTHPVNNSSLADIAMDGRKEEWTSGFIILKSLKKATPTLRELAPMQEEESHNLGQAFVLYSVYPHFVQSLLSHYPWMISSQSLDEAWISLNYGNRELTFAVICLSLLHPDLT